MKRLQEEQEVEDIKQERKKKKLSEAESEASKQITEKSGRKFILNCHHEHIHDFVKFMKSEFNDKLQLPENESSIKISAILGARNFFGDVNFLKLEEEKLKNSTIPWKIDVSCIVELDLSCNKLKSFPNGLEKLPKLEILNLSSNKLDQVPEGFAKFNDQLKVLNMRHNFLGSVANLKDCKNLSKLTISCNKLSSLEGVEGSSGSLKSLFLFGNRFTFEEIVKKMTEHTFQNLEEISLSGNNFSFAGCAQNLGFSPKLEKEEEEKIEQLKKILPALKKIESISI